MKMDLVQAIRIIREKDGKLLKEAGEAGHIADICASDARDVAQAWQVIAQAAQRPTGGQELAEALAKAKEGKQ